LPGRDPLSDAIRLGHVVACERTFRDDVLYTLGASENPLAAWVFIHRSGEGQRLDGVDDPRGLFAALSIGGAPREPMARLLFEQLLHAHYQRERHRRIQAGEIGAFPDLSAERRTAAEVVGQAAAAAAIDQLRPVEGTEADDRLETLWATAGVTATGGHQAWQERPHGHLTFDELIRLRRQSRIEAQLAERRASVARAEAQLAGQRAASGEGPNAVALRDDLLRLQAAAGHERAMLAAQREADGLLRQVALMGRGPARPKAAGLRGWWARLWPDSGGQADGLQGSQAAGTSREQLVLAAARGLERAKAERTALVAAGLGPKPSHRLEGLLQVWPERHRAAVIADEEEAVRIRAELVALAVSSDAGATARRDLVRDVEAELAVRAALPAPVAASEIHARALSAAEAARSSGPGASRLRARTRPHPGPSTGWGPQPGVGR
jgi:hypothetical protein